LGINKILTLILLASSTFSQEDNLFNKSIEELLKVDVVSLKEETLVEAPAVLSILTQQDFKNLGAKSLKDILSFIPGVYNLSSSDFRDSAAASIRAQHSSSIDKHILILIDNRPLRESYSSGLNNDIFNGFPIEAIDRVEVIRGPSSVLYGSNAFEGVINIKLKEENTHSRISVAKGELGQNILEAHTSRAYEDSNINISTRFSNITGWKDEVYDDSLKVGTYDQYSQNKNFLLNGNYKNTELTFMATNSKDRTLGGDNSFDALLIDHSRLFANIGHKFTLNEDSSIEVYSTLNTIDTNHEGERHSKANDILGEFIYKHSISENIFFVLGSSISYVTGNNKSTNAQTRNFHDVANNYYTQIDWKILNVLKIQSGVQLHKTKQQTSDISPRVGLVYSLNNNFSIKALYGQAYRAPSGFERSISLRIGSGGLDGNPNLKSEKIETSSLSISYQDQYSFGALTFYSSKQKNSIRVYFDPDLTNEDDFKNSGKSEYEGFELEFQRRFDDLTFYFNSTYQENRDYNNTPNTQKTPNFMFKIGGTYKLNSNISIGLYDQYFSKIKSNETSNELNKPSKDFHDLRLNISYSKELTNHFFSSFYTLLQINNTLEKDSIYQPDVSTSKINTIPHKMGRNIMIKSILSF